MSCSSKIYKKKKKKHTICIKQRESKLINSYKKYKNPVKKHPPNLCVIFTTQSHGFFDTVRRVTTETSGICAAAPHSQKQSICVEVKMLEKDTTCTKI